MNAKNILKDLNDEFENNVLNYYICQGCRVFRENDDEYDKDDDCITIALSDLPPKNCPFRGGVAFWKEVQ